MNKYDIGRRIEAYRDKLHMSTQELAERIKRSQATISRIENGKQGLTFELLSSIASELRVHPFALLSDEPLRSSILHPAGEDDETEYAPNLLANALHAGRVKRRLRMDMASDLLGISPEELEAVELAMSCPDNDLLERMCELYGLVPQHMHALKRFGEEATDIARGLAYLQQLFSHIHHLVHKVADGDEKRVVERIADLLNSADSEFPLPLESTSDDVGLFLNRLSLHLVNALKDKEFRGKMFELAGLNTADSPQPVDTRGT